MDTWNGIIEFLAGAFTVQSPSLNLLFKATLAVLCAFLVWLIVGRAVRVLEKKLSSHKFVTENHQIFQMLRTILACALMLVTGTYLMVLFELQFLKTSFRALIIIILAKPINAFFMVALVYLERHLAEKTETMIDDIIFNILKKFSGVIIYGIAMVLALDVLGINVMPFVAGAGVMGIAIGFAAKDTLSNLIAGVLLIIDRPFEIGDRIEVWSAPVGSATWGDVMDIGLRATKIRTTDNIIIIIPNNEIMKRDIVNYTIITSRIRVRVNIGIAYDADLSKTKSVVLAVADATPWILKDPVPVVVVTAFGESSVDLQLRVWISDARKRMNTISHVTDRVKVAFDEAGIEIPYPRRDVNLIMKSGSDASPGVLAPILRQVQGADPKGTPPEGGGD